MTTITSSRSRWVLAAAIPVGLIASGLLVWQSSFAAFTATTTNPGNTFESGTVVLTDNGAGTAVFGAAQNANLVPGSTLFKCIDVTYSGSVAARVKFYATYELAGGVPNSALAQYLDFSVDQVDATVPCAATGNLLGDGALYGAGTLGGLVSANSSFATGLGTWAPTGAASDTRRYRFRYVLQNTDAAQGKATSVALTWQAQNT